MNGKFTRIMVHRDFFGLRLPDGEALKAGQDIKRRSGSLITLILKSSGRVLMLWDLWGCFSRFTLS